MTWKSNKLFEWQLSITVIACHLSVSTFISEQACQFIAWNALVKTTPHLAWAKSMVDFCM